MTEQDILRRQEINGQREYYLMLMGQFYHAYGHGAFALSRVTGYRVMRKQRRGGEVLTVGFPINCLERVQTRIQENKGQIRQLDEKTFLAVFDGVPTFSVPASELPCGLLDLLAVKTRIFPSKGEARNMVKGGGVSVNKDKVSDLDRDVTPADIVNGHYILLQKGKKNYYIVNII